MEISYIVTKRDSWASLWEWFVAKVRARTWRVNGIVPLVLLTYLFCLFIDIEIWSDAGSVSKACFFLSIAFGLLSVLSNPIRWSLAINRRYKWFPSGVQTSLRVDERFIYYRCSYWTGIGDWRLVTHFLKTPGYLMLINRQSEVEITIPLRVFSSSEEVNLFTNMILTSLERAKGPAIVSLKRQIETTIWRSSTRYKYQDGPANPEFERGSNALASEMPAALDVNYVSLNFVVTIRDLKGYRFSSCLRNLIPNRFRAFCQLLSYAALLGSLRNCVDFGIVLGVIVGGLYIFCYFALLFRNITLDFRRIRNYRSAVHLQEYWYEITTDFDRLIVRTQLHWTDIDCRYIDKISKNAQAIYITFVDNSGLTVPKRAFSDAQAYDEFYRKMKLAATQLGRG